MTRTKKPNGTLLLFSVETEEAYTVTEQLHQGRKHLVIPVTMMVEGVHSGSMGPILHTISQLGKFPGSWDGIPVIIDHPKKDGNYVSANSPDIVDSEVIGRVYNTYVDDKKLRGEVWVDEEKLRQVSSSVLAEIKAGNMMEVSVGVFTDDDPTPGVWNGEAYDSIAINHRPDHLALLPGGTGACSTKDGCGLRANKKGGIMKKEDVFDVLKSIAVSGFGLNGASLPEDTEDDAEEQGLYKILEAVRTKLNSMDSNDSYHTIEEVYADSLVYCVYFRIGDSKMYKQGYKLDNSGGVEMVGDPVEVRKKVEYVNANQKMERTRIINNNSKKEDTKMSVATGCAKCVEKVNALIANTELGFVETDRAWLDTLSESALDKVAPKVIVNEKIVEKTIEVNTLSDEDKSILAYGKKQMKERKEKMIETIKANTAEGTWTDDSLAAMNEDTLERVFNSVKKEEVVNFSLNSNTNLNANKGKGIQPMLHGIVEDVK